MLRPSGPKLDHDAVGVADDVRVGHERAVAVDEEAGARAHVGADRDHRRAGLGVDLAGARLALVGRDRLAGDGRQRLDLLRRRAAGRRRRRRRRRRPPRRAPRQPPSSAGWCAAARPLAAPPRDHARPPQAPRAGAPPPPPQPRVPARIPGATRPSTDAGETSSPWRVGMPSSAVGKAVWSRRRLVVLLGALSAFGPLSMDMYLPGLPSMARDLSAPAWAAQLTITTSMLGLACGQLVAGPISDALGRRRPAAHRRGRLHGRPRCCAPPPRPSGCCSPSASCRAWPERPGSSSRARSCATCTKGSRPRASSPCSCSSAAWRRSSLPWSAARCCT